jgi:transketolase
MYAVTEHDGPVYLRLTRDKSPLVFDEDYDFEIGRAAVTREGGDITIVSTGVQTTRAMQAASDLASEGIQAHVLHVATLKPIDKEAIVTAAEKTNLVLTSEEHTVVGGLGAAVAEVLGQERPTLMRIHGLDDVNIESGPNEALLEQYRISPQWIALEAKALLARAGV